MEEGEMTVPRPAWERTIEKCEDGWVAYNDSPCWVFTGYRSVDGYGRIGVGSKLDGTARLKMTHRVMYEHFVGSIPEGLQIDHLCRTRACCNPSHLEPVTPRENSQRGISPELTAARQRAKTHCPRGHEYDVENTRVRPNGWRDCRACSRKQGRERYRKGKGAKNVERSEA